MRRAFDIVASLAGLVVAVPVVAVLALIIRAESPGAAIFAQDRVGRDGRVFRCRKLRTMRLGTADVPTHLADASRVTRVGAFLRATKLDELPQLWNILAGEMTFVGPRPCLPSQVQLVEERRRRGVLSVLPGITGLAQVEGIDMSDPVRLAARDADYVASRTAIGDLGLAWRTVVGGEGRGDRVRGA